MATEDTNTITQEEGERFALAHQGTVSLYGEKDKDALTARVRRTNSAYYCQTAG